MDLQGNNYIRITFFIGFLLGIKYLLYELFRFDDQNQQRLFKRSKNKQFVTSVNLFTHVTKQFIIFIAQKMRRFLPKYIMQVIIFFCILFQI